MPVPSRVAALLVECQRKCRWTNAGTKKRKIGKRKKKKKNINKLIKKIKKYLAWDNFETFLAKQERLGKELSRRDRASKRACGAVVCVAVAGQHARLGALAISLALERINRSHPPIGKTGNFLLLPAGQFDMPDGDSKRPTTRGVDNYFSGSISLSNYQYLSCF
jgi:hypothetical protein